LTPAEKITHRSLYELKREFKVGINTKRMFHALLSRRSVPRVRGTRKDIDGFPPLIQKKILAAFLVSGRT
jgi:hypothetical protein